MENICRWRELLSNRALQALIANKIVDGRLLPALRSIEEATPERRDSVRRLLLLCEGVVRALPPAWLRPSSAEHKNETPQWLALFHDFTRRLCLQCKASACCDETISPEFLSALLAHFNDALA